MPDPATPAIRPVEPRDLAQINTLLDRVWFPRKSAAGFDWLIRQNPGQSGLPAGWVVQDRSGHVSAFLGNFVQKAWRAGHPHLIASGHSFVAAPDQGGRALSLLRTFLRQDAPVLLSGMNANPVSARIYTAMKLAVYPESGSLKLSWITNPALVALGALSWRAHELAGGQHMRRIPDIARPAPDIDAILLRHTEDVQRITSPATHTGLAVFDAQLRAGPRLFAERSPEALAWRLADPDQAVPPILLAYPQSGPIRGLALFQFNKPSEAEPPYLDIIDLVTLDPDDGVAVQVLLHAGLALARHGRAARLRLAMVTPTLLCQLGPLAQSARQSTSETPHAFYKANPNMPAPVSDTWQPLPYDGDNGPSLRPLPIRLR